MNKERLLNVAKALRESKHPDQFTMVRYVNPCGTPACALGHYEARPDLQDALSCSPYGHLNETIDTILSHFGLSIDDSRELFDAYGCGNAQTVEDAAQYIERFVASRSNQTEIEE